MKQKGEIMKKQTLILAALLASTPAMADSIWHCVGSECVGATFDNTPGSYNNPIEDRPFTGDWSGPVHRGMYCANGAWHHGWLRAWEGNVVVKASCGGRK